MINKDKFFEGLLNRSKPKEEMEEQNKVQGVLLAARVADTDCINFDSFSLGDIELAKEVAYEIDEINQSASNPFINCIIVENVKNNVRGLKSLYMPSSEDFF